MLSCTLEERNTSPSGPSERLADLAPEFQERKVVRMLPSAEATSVEVATYLKHLLWSLPPHVHQRCDTLTSSSQFTSALCGNKDALAPCDWKLDGAGESWSFLHSKNKGEKSVFAGNDTPLGAGVMFSTG